MEPLSPFLKLIIRRGRAQAELLLSHLAFCSLVSLGNGELRQTEPGKWMKTRVQVTYLAARDFSLSSDFNELVFDVTAGSAPNLEARADLL